MKKNLNIGTNIIDVNKIKQQNPVAVAVSTHSNAKVEKKLSQGALQFICRLKYLKTNRQDTRADICLSLLGLILSGPHPLTSGLVSTFLRNVY